VLEVPAPDTDPVALQRLGEDVRRLYLEDYARRWDAFLADIRLLPAQDLSHATQMARILSAPQSPLATLLQAVVHETTLGAREPARAGVAGRAGDTLRDARESRVGRLGEEDPTRIAQAIPGSRFESIVDDRYAGLRALVRGSGS